ncbi:hypothetical protein ACLMAB_05630 [Brevibacillus laterosporus]
MYAISKALGIRIEDLFEISKNEEE